MTKVYLDMNIYNRPFDDQALYPEPTINSTYFPNTYANYYWSSTNAYNANAAWYVDFGIGYVSSNYKSRSNYVRCVRGGQ